MTENIPKQDDLKAKMTNFGSHVIFYPERCLKHFGDLGRKGETAQDDYELAEGLRKKVEVWDNKVLQWQR